MSTKPHTASVLEKTALQHAQDLQHTSLKIFLVFLAIALGAFWAAISDWGFVWKWIAGLAILAAFAAGVAGFVSGVRVFQLSKNSS
jgi:hypothetical protein